MLSVVYYHCPLDNSQALYHYVLYAAVAVINNIDVDEDLHSL